MKQIKINNKIIGMNKKPYIIAEAGINHNGNIKIAKELIKQAKNIGADAVKFQSFTVECMMTKTAASAEHLDAGAGKEDVYSFVKRISLSENEHRELFIYAKELEIEFISTPFSFKTVDWLEKLGVSCYKIASMDLNNLPLIKYVAERQKPIILSTGMGTIAEVDQALRTIYKTGNQDVILLHCVSLYPPSDDNINLKVLNTLENTFDCLVGFSDHTEDNLISLAAVARGAKVIEKHFTLDKKMPGPDQKSSGDPETFKRLIDNIKRIYSALGSGIKKPVEAELKMQKNFRRSIVAKKDIEKNEVITKEKVTFKRPGSGIPPTELEWVLGTKAKNNIKSDTLISKEDLVG
ncbi:MAG: N-acetylneuraminate synthase [Rhodothermaceae bacterium]